MIDIIEKLIAPEHQQLSLMQDAETAAWFIVSIHNSKLGPALGGCRMLPYANLEAAILDALRLSEGMTYKNSLAGLNLGGGKSVIFLDPKKDHKREQVLRNYAEFVSSLAGAYYTAEDMGTTVADLKLVAESCKYVSGISPELGSLGDPSPYTARGVFLGIKACLKHCFSSDDLTGRTVAIQGVGNVGRHLLRLLSEASASVLIADTNSERAARLGDEFAAQVLTPEEILKVDCDVFSPCATGAVINKHSVAKFKCRIIAGAANNQLATAEMDSELSKRGILYAPDFAINAGGVIMCAEELEPSGISEARIQSRISKIEQTIASILQSAQRTQRPSGQVALELAKQRLA